MFLICSVGVILEEESDYTAQSIFRWINGYINPINKWINVSEGIIIRKVMIHCLTLKKWIHCKQYAHHIVENSEQLDRKKTKRHK